MCLEALGNVAFSKSYKERLASSGAQPVGKQIRNIRLSAQPCEETLFSVQG